MAIKDILNESAFNTPNYDELTEILDDLYEKIGAATAAIEQVEEQSVKLYGPYAFYNNNSYEAEEYTTIKLDIIKIGRETYNIPSSEDIEFILQSFLCDASDTFVLGIEVPKKNSSKPSGWDDAKLYIYVNGQMEISYLDCKVVFYTTKPLISTQLPIMPVN